MRDLNPETQNEIYKFEKLIFFIHFKNKMATRHLTAERQKPSSQPKPSTSSSSSSGSNKKTIPKFMLDVDVNQFL